MPNSVFTDMIVEKPVLLDSKEDGKTRVRFKATQANVLNDNNRIYPSNVMQDAQERSNSLIKENRMVGETPHPKHYMGKNQKVVFDSKVENSVIKIVNQFMEDSGEVFVDTEILDTAKGRDLKALVDAGVPVGISMRAVGDSVKKQINGVMVDVATRLDIQSYDIVMNPATPGCEVVQVLTDSQIAEVMADDVQITVPNCPSCGSPLTPQDPDNDNDLDFYSCETCKEVYIPEENYRVSTVASQSLRKLPNDPAYDGYSLAIQYKMGMAATDPNAVTDGKLSADDRKNMKSSDFAVPGKRMLPINDKDHVEMAWKMVDKTKGLTDEEKKDAKSKIKAKAKSFGIDTSAWTDGIEEEDEMTPEQILSAIKDNQEFKTLVAEQAKLIAQPALDAVEAQKNAQVAAEALEAAKAETKTFTDSKIAELKDKLPTEVLTLMTDSVKDATDKSIAGALIDSMVNVYSQTSAKANLDNLGFNPNAQQPNGAVRVQVTNEQKPWYKHMKKMADSMDREAIQRGETIDPSIRKVNQAVVDKLIEHAEKTAVLFDAGGNPIKHGYEAMKDSAAFMDSVMEDSVSVTTGQVLNQPTISALLLQQTFQDVESLQFLNAEAFQGSEVRFMSEFYNSVATIDPATGILDILVPEGTGIQESSIQTSWVTFNPAWRRNAISMTTDVMNTMMSGPAKYDVLSRGIFHISAEKRRLLDTLAYLEMVSSSDEYKPLVVANEVATGVGASAGNITAVSNGTNVVYKYNLTNSGAATATAGTNPVVRPRKKKQIGPNGQTTTVVSNPFTVTVGGSALTAGYLDGSGNIQGGTYAVDYENGVVYFTAAAGLSGTNLPTFSYSGMTNYDRWSTAIGSGYTKNEEWYNTLIQQITTTAASMGSAPRYKRPNTAIMSMNTAAKIQNATMWYKLNDPVIGSLSGLAASTNFGQRSNVAFAQINAPWVGGDGRILLTQKGSTKYAVETPYQIEGPYPKYDGNGNIVDAKVFYGRENSVMCTPLNVDNNGQVINPVSRSIKLV